MWASEADADSTAVACSGLQGDCEGHVMRPAHLTLPKTSLAVRQRREALLDQ